MLDAAKAEAAAQSKRIRTCDGGGPAQALAAAVYKVSVTPPPRSTHGVVRASSRTMEYHPLPARTPRAASKSRREPASLTSACVTRPFRPTHTHPLRHLDQR